jgi:uncharacterized protein (TIGR04255 family)
MTAQLRNPPLIEAILEIKWNLSKKSPDVFEDPGYKLASGRLYDRIKKRFGYLKNLPITMMPEEMTAYTVRHQFRAEDNGWPLVQLGPGVATVNFTSPYHWKLFKETVQYFIPRLVESYQGVIPGQPDDNIKIASILLRYINGIEFNWRENDALDFLASKMHTDFSPPEEITAQEIIQGTPQGIYLQVGYRVSEPSGQGTISFSTGNIGQAEGLIWELTFRSLGNDAPRLDNITEFLAWLNGAHDIIEKWFFSLIEGELHDSFKGE